MCRKSDKKCLRAQIQLIRPLRIQHRREAARWKKGDGSRGGNKTSPRGTTTNTHPFLSRSADYLRRRCPVLQVRSCRCDCRQKTSHWKRERSMEGSERTHTHTSTSDSVVSFSNMRDNSSLNGIMQQNLISTQPSVWQIHHFSVCPMRGLLYDWDVCQNNTRNILLDGAVFHRILRCPDCCFGVI